MSISDDVTQPGSIAGDFPPDPLLSTGSFISSPTTAGDGTLGSEAIGMSDEVNPSESKSRKRSAPLDNWLPPGWRVEDKVRASGATAGTVDKYYLEPITGCKFRSRTEVLYYLEHGTTPKKGSKKAKNTVSSSDHLEGKGRNKSSRKAKEPPPLPPLNFDFENPPEKVSWSMTDAGEEAWIPFLGDDKVQHSVRRDWCTAFTVITTKNPSRCVKQFLECKIGDGATTSFWFDNWSSLEPLVDVARENGPCLMGIPKHAIVDDASRPSFRGRQSRSRNPSISMLNVTELPAISKGRERFSWRKTGHRRLEF